MDWVETAWFELTGAPWRNRSSVARRGYSNTNLVEAAFEEMRRTPMRRMFMPDLR